MSESETEEEKQLIKLEEAKTDRSTCRASNEKIEKGEWRVGIEAWRGGRKSMTWQKAPAFLNNCLVEECTKANSGTCKKTGHKFEKGETRFVYTTGTSKFFLSISALEEIIKPVVDVADGFQAKDLQGVDSIPQSEKAQILKAFGSPKVSVNKKEGTRKSLRGDPDSGEADEKSPKRQKNEDKKEKTSPAKTSSKREKNEGKEEKVSSVKKAKSGKDSKAVKSVKKEGELELIGEPLKSSPADNKVKSEIKAEESSEDEILEDGEEAGNESMEEGELEKGPGSPGNKFEKQRQARIQANMERMKNMGILDDARKIMPKNQPKPRTQPKGVSAKKKKVEYSGPRRSSARVQGLVADGKMIHHEGQGGKIQYKEISDQYRLDPNGPPSVWNVTESEKDVVPKERHHKEPINFVPEGEDHDIYSTFLDVLKKCKFSKGKPEKGKTKLHNLKMKEEDLAKVTANGISHVQWLPSSNSLIVAAGDKSGNVGIWNVNHKNASEEDDGVYVFSTHNSYISGLRWSNVEGATPSLYTASYDGSVRSLDIQAEKYQLTISSEDSEFSSMDCTSNGNVIFMGDNDGDLTIFDVREYSGEKRGNPFELHNKRVNTIHLEPGNEVEILTASSDCATSIWDIRKFSDSGKCKPISSHVHTRTVQSAYFAPDGSKRLVTLGRDDTVGIWKANGSALKLEVNINHYNNTGRWVIPFRAVWSPSSDAIIVGSMKRQVDIYDASGSLLANLDSPYMTAIASRSNAHPFHNALAACTNSGRIHIFR